MSATLSLVVALGLLFCSARATCSVAVAPRSLRLGSNLVHAAASCKVQLVDSSGRILVGEPQAGLHCVVFGFSVRSLNQEQMARTC
jgi:hypothetical protein